MKYSGIRCPEVEFTSPNANERPFKSASDWMDEPVCVMNLLWNSRSRSRWTNGLTPARLEACT